MKNPGRKCSFIFSFFCFISLHGQLAISVITPTGCFTAGTTVTCMVTGTIQGAQGYTFTTSNTGGCASTVTAVNATMALIAYGCCGTKSINCAAYSSSSVNLGSINTTANLSCPANINIQTTTPMVCAGGAVANVTATPGSTASYTWSTGATGSVATLQVQSPTVFSVTGTFTNGCTNTQTVSINVYSPTVNTNLTYTAVCLNTTLILSGTGANTYTWLPMGANFPSVHVSPSSTTIYSLSATSSSLGVSCIARTTVTVAVVSANSISLQVLPANPCPGSAVSVTATGAANYTWNTSQTGSVITTTMPLAGNASFSVTGSAGTCPNASAAIVVTPQPSPSITIVQSSVVCEGQPVLLTASGAQTYTWNNNVQNSTITVTALNGTVYSVVGAGSGTNACNGTGVYTISTVPLPVVIISSTPVPVCSATSVTLSASGAQTYTWNNLNTGPSIVVTATASVYTATGQSGTGCLNTGTYNLVVNPSPTVTGTSNRYSICVGEKIILTPGGALSYTWMPGAGNGTVPMTPSVSTIYTLTGKNLQGCSAVATVSITVSMCTGFDPAEITGMSLYPNPTTGLLHIKHEGRIDVRIYAMDGEVIYSADHVETNELHDLTAQKAGAYLVSVKNDAGIKHFLLVKY